MITQAHAQGKKFRIVIVDSRPKQEGKVFTVALIHFLFSKGLAPKIGEIRNQVHLCFDNSHFLYYA